MVLCAQSHSPLGARAAVAASSWAYRLTGKNSSASEPGRLEGPEKGKKRQARLYVGRVVGRASWRNDLDGSGRKNKPASAEQSRAKTARLPSTLCPCTLRDPRCAHRY